MEEERPLPGGRGTTELMAEAVELGAVQAQVPAQDPGAALHPLAQEAQD